MENNHWKDINPFWRLVDPLSVEQEAALIAGFDPNTVDSSRAYFKDRETGLTCSDGIARVKTAFEALANAVNADMLKATIRRTAWERGWDEEPGAGERFASFINFLEADVSEASSGVEPKRSKLRGIIYRVDPDWSRTTIYQNDIRSWLKSKNFPCEFFFPSVVKDGEPDYLDPSPNNLRYAPKLAAAVRAWQAITEPKGRSPKQALVKWLREHAAEFALSDDEGKPNETGIEEVAKVANWLPGGGAAKTPGG